MFPSAEEGPLAIQVGVSGRGVQKRLHVVGVPAVIFIVPRVIEEVAEIEAVPHPLTVGLVDEPIANVPDMFGNSKTLSVEVIFPKFIV